MPPQDPESARWFAENLQTHEAPLRIWLKRQFPAIDDVDGIIQDAYLRILKARERRPILEPKSLFYTTARNLAYNHYHKYHVGLTDRLESDSDTPIIDESMNVPESVARHEEITLMTRAIQSLPDRCRQVMTLRIVYNMAYKEIAEELGISVKTVEIQIAIGFRRCSDYVAQFRTL